MQKSFFSFSLYLLQTLQYFLSFRDRTRCALSRYSNACRHTGNAECPDRILLLQILRNEVSGIGISGSGWYLRHGRDKSSEGLFSPPDHFLCPHRQNLLLPGSVQSLPLEILPAYSQVLSAGSFSPVSCPASTSFRINMDIFDRSHAST